MSCKLKILQKYLKEVGNDVYKEEKIKQENVELLK